MRWTSMHKWLKATFRRSRMEEEMSEEMRFHIDARMEDLMNRGLSAEEASRRARLEFGSVEKHKDEGRQARGLRFLDDLRGDLRIAARTLGRRPGFAAAATLTLALGIGATATVFALLDTVLLRPLPVSDPDTLAHIYKSCRRGDVYCSSSYPEFLDYRAQSGTFADMAAFAPMELNLRAESAGWVGSGLLVSTNYFSLLGVAPHAGQFFSPTWDVRSDPPLVFDSSKFQGPIILAEDSGFRFLGYGPLRVFGAFF